MSALTFFREFVRNPKSIGSVTPSGRALAELIVDSAQILPGNVVVELGAGTGPFTRVLAERYPENPLIALEPAPDLAAALRAALPNVTVAERYAQDLPQILAAEGHAKCHRVISGLPWTVWSEELQNSILDAVCGSLDEEGRLVTFMYVHSQMLPGATKLLGTLQKRFDTVEKSKVAWANVPPALVWIASRPRKA
jgi:phosphatidylethanolamine/phosphatidyl-N-methylethanolamine N-methyltransferase